MTASDAVFCLQSLTLQNFYIIYSLLEHLVRGGVYYLAVWYLKAQKIG